jgi:hypothetical protein
VGYSRGVSVPSGYLGCTLGVLEGYFGCSRSTLGVLEEVLKASSVGYYAILSGLKR